MIRTAPAVGSDSIRNLDKITEREVEWPEPEEGDDYAPDEALFDLNPRLP